MSEEKERIAVCSKGRSTCGQRDMKWAPLRHISDLELQEMMKMSSGTLIALTWYQNRLTTTPNG